MPLPEWELKNGNTAVCTLCQAPNSVHVFPSAFSANGASRPESADEGEAACFDHPGKKAIAACSQCGRFVCNLCSVEFGKEIWCPSCVTAGAGRARSANRETARTLYDSIAFTMPLVSLILYPFTIVAAPASVILSIAKWRAPISLVRRSRWRFVAAILIGLSEIVGWTLVFYKIFTTTGSRGPA